MGYTQCLVDPCIFVRTSTNGEPFVYITRYIDNLLVACTKDVLADQIHTALCSRFTVKSLGEVRFME